MGQLIERLKNRLGVDPSSRETRRAKVLASNDLEFLASLVDLRRAQNISQGELAEKLGISQATIAAFERTDNDPKLSTIRRYAHGVGALVVHRVALDQGQLDGDEVVEWDAATARREGFKPMPIAACNFPISVQIAATLNSHVIWLSPDSSTRENFAPIA